METLIVQPLEGSGISTVITIDALDECEDKEPALAILSKFLEGSSPRSPGVKFFLTGRQEPRILTAFLQVVGVGREDCQQNSVDQLCERAAGLFSRCF